MGGPRSEHEPKPKPSQWRPSSASGYDETFAEVRTATYWFWLYCRGCTRAQPCAVTPFLIRWGPAAPVANLPRRARCRQCGHLGGGLQWPGWKDTRVGRSLWPTHPSLIPVGAVGR
jgi:hypothetical protein